MSPRLSRRSSPAPETANRPPTPARTSHSTDTHSGRCVGIPVLRSCSRPVASLLERQAFVLQRSGRRHVALASASPVAQRNGDGPRPRRTTCTECRRSTTSASRANYGPWRPVVTQVADKSLAFGVLDHGFARIRCDACTHEYLLAFSCTCRSFCPSCHAKRLAIWTEWLDTRLLAPVPHRPVVLTIPKRRRVYMSLRPPPARHDRPRRRPHRHRRHPHTDGRA